MKRDSRIDLLRFIGISLLVLAHISPPEFIFELRSFDVVLIIFLSGASYSYSSKKTYIEYTKGRIKHLIVPVELYLIAYFAFFNLLSMTGLADVSFTLKDYVLSFTLISGVGLVWIYRVYILMAVEAPFLKKAGGYIESKSLLLLLLIPIGILYEVCVLFVSEKTGVLWRLVEYFILYAAGYGAIYAIGVYINRLSKRTIYIIALVSLVIFAVSGLIYAFPRINDFKYPPRLYYLTYGLFISLFLWIVSSANKFIQNLGNVKFIVWFSKYSMLIYLWHSIPLRFLEYGIIDLGVDNFVLRYIFIFTCSVALTAIHVKAKELLHNKLASRGKAER